MCVCGGGGGGGGDKDAFAGIHTGGRDRDGPSKIPAPPFSKIPPFETSPFKSAYNKVGLNHKQQRSDNWYASVQTPRIFLRSTSGSCHKYYAIREGV